MVRELEDLFPESNHVALIGLQTATDEEVWEYARDNGFVIVTQDSDFYERSLIYGYPPKVLWLRTGNTSTQNLHNLLKKHIPEILLFIDFIAATVILLILRE